MDLLPVVLEKDGIPVTTSKAVAEQFGKRHDSVIRDIENLLNLHKSVEIESDTTKEFLKQNFIEATYTDSKGRTQPQYIMTKDGFTLLVMGYTGAKALQFKIAYINAFMMAVNTLNEATKAFIADFIGGGYTVALIPYRLLQSLTACERGLYKCIA